MPRYMTSALVLCAAVLLPAQVLCNRGYVQLRQQQQAPASQVASPCKAAAGGTPAAGGASGSSGVVAGGSSSYGELDVLPRQRLLEAATAK